MTLPASPDSRGSCVATILRAIGLPERKNVWNPTRRLRIEVHRSILQGRQMDIIEEFQKHADECRRMARATRDFDTKVVWNRMAERWQTLLAAEQARTRQRSEARARRRHAAHGGAEESRAA